MMISYRFVFFEKHLTGSQFFFYRSLFSDTCVSFFCSQVWFTAPTFFFFLYYVNLSLYHVLLYELLVAVLSLTLNKFVSSLK